MYVLSTGYECSARPVVMAVLETDPPAHSPRVTRRDIVHTAVEPT
jgi:hypothetical protein